VAIIVVMPVAFGINIPLNSVFSLMPVWGVIMIKVQVGDSGFFARVADTEGNVIAIWQQMNP